MTRSLAAGAVAVVVLAGCLGGEGDDASDGTLDPSVLDLVAGDGPILSVEEAENSGVGVIRA